MVVTVTTYVSSPLVIGVNALKTTTTGKLLQISRNKTNIVNLLYGVVVNQVDWVLKKHTAILLTSVKLLYFYRTAFHGFSIVALQDINLAVWVLVHLVGVELEDLLASFWIGYAR